MCKRGNHEGSIAKRSDGRFQASLMVDGRRKYYYAKKRGDCVTWLTDMRTKLRQGMPVTDNGITVLEWCRHYIDQYCKGYVRPATLYNYMGYVDKHITGSSLAGVRLSQLNTDHIQHFMNTLHRADGNGELSAHTERNIWLFLSGALNKAEKCGLVWRNAAKRVRLRPSDKKERPYLTNEQVQQLIQAAINHPWCMGIVILAHGLRISEMLALRRSNIITIKEIRCLDVKLALKRELQLNAQKGTARTVLRLSETKTKSSVRQVPIVPSALPMLEYLCDWQDMKAQLNKPVYIENPFIIANPDTGECVDPERFRKFFREMVKKADLPEETTPHALRHFAARVMVRSVSPAAAARVLGHQQPTTTLNYYIKENLEQAFVAVQTLGRCI